MMKIIDTPESRVFECKLDSGQFVALRVQRANRRELEAADLEQSRVFNQALLAGLPPRMRLLRKLREQALWTSEDDTNLNRLREQVARLDVRLAELAEEIKKAEGEARDPLEKEKDAAIKDRAVVNRQLTQLRQEIDGMLGHTADAKAEDSHRNFLLACVAEKVQILPDQSIKVVARVWESLDALMAETDTNLLQRTIYEYMMFAAGLPSEWDKDLAATQEAETKPANPTTTAAVPAGDGGGEGESAAASDARQETPAAS